MSIPSQELRGMLKVGDRFPEFSATAVVSSDPKDAFTTITSQDFPNKWLVIFAWPKDFTFVCPTEIAEFNRVNGEFQDRDAQILGFSIDGEFVHLAWRQSHEDLKDLQFPMLADVSRELTLQCGIMDNQAKVAQRALYIVDPQGMIRFCMMTDMSVGRSPREVLRVLDALQTGGRCPCEWQPGDETI